MVESTKLLNVRETCQRLGVCRSTLYKWVREDRFPAPLHVTPTMPRWRSDEVDQFIAELSEARTA